jgi:hypothetical protein
MYMKYYSLVGFDNDTKLLDPKMKGYMIRQP